MDEYISIVVATKNAMPSLRRLVEAVLDTQPEAVALVIADGGSVDGTTDWLTTLAPAGGMDRVRWISQPDSGIAEAWNRGVALARGEWVVFLGADDVPGEQSAWKHAVQTLATLPAACSLAAFPVTITSPSGVVIEEQSPQLGPGNATIFTLNTLPHQGLFHRRDIWQRLGPFDARYPVASDYEFVIRALVAGETIRLCPGPPPVHMTFGGASSRDPARNLREFRHIQVAHGVRRFRLRWWLAWLRACARDCIRPLLGEASSRRLADAIRGLRGLPKAWTVP